MRILFLFLFSKVLLANQFDDEFIMLEHKNQIPKITSETFSDEVKLNNSGLKKDEIKNNDNDLTVDDLFYKTKEVKPRRVRSR